MNYVVYTTKGQELNISTIFDSNLLTIKLEKDIDNGLAFIILHPGKNNEIIIAFDITALEGTKGGNRIRKFTTKTKKCKYKVENKKYSRKYNKKYNKKYTRKYTRKYNLVGGFKLNKFQIFIIVVYILNILFFPIIFPEGEGIGPRTENWQNEGLSLEVKNILDNLEVEVIPGSLSIEDLNINVLGLLRNGEIDILRKINNSSLIDLTNKKVAVANKQNSHHSPSYQLSNLITKLAYPDLGFTKFAPSNSLYGITSNWKLNKNTGDFNIKLYNITGSNYRANLPKYKDLYSLVIKTINEQLQTMNSLGMIPEEASEGWFELFFIQLAPKSFSNTLGSPYHFDGHTTLMDTNLGLNDPRSGDLNLDKLRDEIRVKRPHRRIEYLTPNISFISPFSGSMTLTYPEDTGRDTAKYKLKTTDTEIEMDENPGKTTTYIAQETGMQHSARSGITSYFPYGGETRYLMVANVQFLYPSLDTQKVDPNILQSEINVDSA